MINIFLFEAIRRDCEYMYDFNPREEKKATTTFRLKLQLSTIDMILSAKDDDIKYQKEIFI